MLLAGQEVTTCCYSAPATLTGSLPHNGQSHRLNSFCMKSQKHKAQSEQKVAAIWFANIPRNKLIETNQSFIYVYVSIQKRIKFKTCNRNWYMHSQRPLYVTSTYMTKTSNIPNFRFFLTAGCGSYHNITRGADAVVDVTRR